MKSMRKLAFLLITLLAVISASAQVDTVKVRQVINAHGYLYKNGGFDSSITFPQDTFRLKSTWRGIGFKDTLPYFWTGTTWAAFGTGSVDTMSLSNRINLKLNITDTTNKWVTAVRRSNDSVFYQKGGTWTYAYKDSTGGGADGYVDSVRFNSSTSILTVYQNTAADQDVYLPPSYLEYDSLYNPLGGMKNDSTGRVKSIRIRNGTSTITPTSTDSTLNFDIPILDTTTIYTNINAKADTASLIVIDTTGATTGQIAYIDRTGGDTIKFKNDSVGTGGSGGSGAFSKLEWFSVDEFAPAVGDSIMVHDSFSGKYLDVYRNGIKQPHVVEDTGWARVNDTTISVLPPFAANEFWHIEARDSSAYTQLVLQEAAPPGASWAYLTLTTQTGHLTNTSNVWTSSAGSFGGYGLETGSFTGEVWVKQQRTAADAALGIIGFNESNTNEANAGYEFACYFDATGAITYLDNGSGSTIGYTLATGSWMALKRAASGTVTIETSADGLTGWTVRYTFTPTSTATFYINGNIHGSYKCYYPQVYY